METASGKIKVLTDAVGRTLKVAEPPKKVISLIPSITESLFEMGLGDNIAGVSKFCVEPAEAVLNKPKVGGQKNPDFEKIRELGPDLILLNLEENKPEHIEELSRSYRTFVTYPRKFIDAAAMLEDISGIFSVDAGGFVKKIREAHVAQTKIGEATAKEPRRCLYLIWKEPWMSVNNDTFIHDVLELHGLKNICAEKKDRYPTLSVDEITALDPDIVILPDEPFRFHEGHINILEKMCPKAAKERNIFLADGKYFCWYGTRTASASEYINRLILK